MLNNVGRDQYIQALFAKEHNLAKAIEERHVLASPALDVISRESRHVLDVAWSVYRHDKDGICAIRIEDVHVGPLLNGSGSTESLEHKTLKHYAGEWLASRGYTNAETELTYPGGRCDVGSLKHRFAVECGNTHPSKIVRAVDHGWSVGWIRYDSTSTVLDRAPRLTAGMRPMAVFSPLGGDGVSLHDVFGRTKAELLEELQCRLNTNTRFEAMNSHYDKAVRRLAAIAPRVAELSDEEVKDVRQIVRKQK